MSNYLMVTLHYLQHIFDVSVRRCLVEMQKRVLIYNLPGQFVSQAWHMAASSTSNFLTVIVIQTVKKVLNKRKYVKSESKNKHKHAVSALHVCRSYLKSQW